MGHGEHAWPSGPKKLVRPGLHRQSEMAPLAAPTVMVSAGHVEHWLLPAALLKVPTSHSLHAPEPAAILKLPMWQAVQTPAPGPVYPGLQKHSETSELPALEVWLTGQAMHETLPPGLLSKNPTTHAQSPTSSDASGDEEPVGQAVQAMFPALFLYDPI